MHFLFYWLLVYKSIQPFVLFIPEEFGGGYIFDPAYQDYGKINDLDMYAILGAMNTDQSEFNFKEFFSLYLEKQLTEQEIKEFNENYRRIGIDCEDEDNNSISKYKLKIRVVRRNQWLPDQIEDLTYENIFGDAKHDPNQGFGRYMYEYDFWEDKLEEINLYSDEGDFDEEKWSDLCVMID